MMFDRRSYERADAFLSRVAELADGELREGITLLRETLALLTDKTALEIHRLLTDEGAMT